MFCAVAMKRPLSTRLTCSALVAALGALLASGCASARETTPAAAPAGGRQSVGDTLRAASLGALASLSGASEGPAACPAGMVMIEGDYCPEVEQTCERWLDPPGTKYAQFRCARYKPSVCKAPRRHMRYCIDRTERVEATSARPQNFVSFDSAKALCAAAGARVCRESEWQFACEGEEMRPYPYGWERDASACNVDHTKHLMEHGHLADRRRDVGADARCASPFGVLDLAGNVEEWVAADGHKMGWRQVLKGSYWIPSRHACRQFQVGHGPEYGGRETGTRCCRDAP